MDILAKNLDSGLMEGLTLGIDRVPQRGELVAVEFGGSESMPYQVHQVVTYSKPIKHNGNKYWMMLLVRGMFDK